MHSLRMATVACMATFTLACTSPSQTPDPALAGETAIGTTGEIGGAADVRSVDADFVESMLGTGAAEIELGKLALARGSSSDVKAFGQQMVAEHTKAGDQLRQLALGFSVPPNTQPGIDEDHRELIAKLSQLNGAEFDREYIDAMVNGHQDVVDLLQSRVDERDRTAVITGQQPREVNVKPEPTDTSSGMRINQWAASTLPVVKGHLERAKTIDHRLNR